MSGEAGRMMRKFTEAFRTGKGSQRRRSVAPAGNVKAPEAGASALDAIEGMAPAVEAFAEFVQPNIVDFVHQEIYDVTTSRLAGAKVAKVRGYTALASAITGRTWRPGTRLRPPGPFTLHYPFRPGEMICYGPTDLQAHPGVLAYEVISTKKKDSKKKKESRTRVSEFRGD